MKTLVEEFFIPNNSVKGISQNDYASVSHIITAAKSFARSTCKCVYIIDYNKRNFLYASQNMAKHGIAVGAFVGGYHEHGIWYLYGEGICRNIPPSDRCAERMRNHGISEEDIARILAE